MRGGAVMLGQKAKRAYLDVNQLHGLGNSSIRINGFDISDDKLPSEEFYSANDDVDAEILEQGDEYVRSRINDNTYIVTDCNCCTWRRKKDMPKLEQPSMPEEENGMLISKIVSGGQTGVDRGALEAALELGFPYGGLIPKGRRAEDGQVPLVFAAMEESTNKDYLYRTEWNVVHSDATLIISPYDESHPDGASVFSGGTKQTSKFCDKHSKPCCMMFNMNASNNIYSTLCWLKRTKEDLGLKAGVVLNVAGPRESKRIGVQAITRKFITELIEAAQTVDEDSLDWKLPDEAYNK
ncbi:MAG: hypothetical protein IKQ17_05225 [Kiritimatiellae bacterium]|nr:hypothetical protein [Kiritimatiellia bacterium]